MRALLSPRRRQSDPDQLAVDAKMLGIEIEPPESGTQPDTGPDTRSDTGPVLEIYDDCLPAYDLYVTSLSQARFTPMGLFAGFDYPGVEAAARLAGIQITPALFNDLRLMEAETTDFLRQAGKGGADG